MLFLVSYWQKCFPYIKPSVYSKTTRSSDFKLYVVSLLQELKRPRYKGKPSPGPSAAVKTEWNEMHRDNFAFTFCR